MWIVSVDRLSGHDLEVPDPQLSLYTLVQARSSAGG